MIIRSVGLQPKAVLGKREEKDFVKVLHEKWDICGEGSSTSGMVYLVIETSENDPNDIIECVLEMQLLPWEGTIWWADPKPLTARISAAFKPFKSSHVIGNLLSYTLSHGFHISSTPLKIPETNKCDEIEGQWANVSSFDSSRLKESEGWWGWPSFNLVFPSLFTYGESHLHLLSSSELLS